MIKWIIALLPLAGLLIWLSSFDDPTVRWRILIGCGVALGGAALGEILRQQNQIRKDLEGVQAQLGEIIRNQRDPKG